MYIDIDPNDNLDEACMATFKETGASAPLHAAKLWRDGIWQWCAITGWADDVPAPALVTLTGELGAGKTTMTQAICRGLGVTEPVTSPTFALIHEYAAFAVRVVHCDLYRLDSARAVASLGLDDMFADSSAIVLVEWPERAGAMLPIASLALTLEHIAAQPDARRCTEVWGC